MHFEICKCYKFEETRRPPTLQEQIMKKFIITISFIAIIAVIGFGIWSQKPEKSDPIPQSAKTEPKDEAPATKADPENQPPPPRLRFGPKNGQTLVYKFTTESEAKLDLSVLTTLPGSSPGQQNVQTGEKTLAHLKVAGELRLRYYKLAPGIWNAAGSVAALNYTVNGRMPRAWAIHLFSK